MSYTAWSVVYGEQPTAAKWNQLGSNDAGFKDGTNIDDDAIITRHIADNAVVAGAIASGAVLLGYGKATANQSGITNVETDLTNLTATVTVPTGGRDLILQAIIPNGNSTGGSADQFRLYFKEGSTYLGTGAFAPANSFGQEINHCVLVENATAGSHTYKVAGKRTNGTGSFATNWSTTSPEIAVPVFLVWGL